MADRENHRIVYFEKKDNFIESITEPGISRTVNSDIWNDHLLVSNLDGTVSYFDRKNQLIDTIKLHAILGGQ